MVYLLYDLALVLSSLILVPYYLLRGLRYGKTRRGIRERLGFFDPGSMAKLKGRLVIWIHAVSVGETKAAIPLLKALRQQYPDAALVLSNVTETGRAVASEVDVVDLCLFFPFDLSWAVRRTLHQVAPTMILIVETEIWPNFVRIAHERGTPVMLVNGRLSDRSFPRYFRFRKYLSGLLGMVASFCMQTDHDARRARRIGAPSERVMVTGNLKFDLAVPDIKDEDQQRIRQSLKLTKNLPIWVAGSTHAGEEEIVARINQRLKAKGLDQILILVPRHPERARLVGEQLTTMGVNWTLRSEIATRSRPFEAGDVLLVDSIGEMLNFYAISYAVFVGGSLVPVGGHNILEALLMKKPVLFGTHMQNFKEISSLVLQSGGGIQVADEGDLEAQLKKLLEDLDRCRKLGINGFALLAEHTGATGKTLGEVSRILEH